MLLTKLKSMVAVAFVALATTSLCYGLLAQGPTSGQHQGPDTIVKENGVKTADLAAEPTAQGPKQKPAQSDRERLVGTWQIINDDSLRKGETWIIREDRILLGADDKLLRFHHLDPGKDPKQIDIIVMAQPDGQPLEVLKGIYVLDGEELRLCLGLGDNARPQAFPKTPGPVAGSARVGRPLRSEVLLLKRQGDKKEEANAPEKKALDELTKTYALRDEEDLKCIKPPYPAARRDWLRSALKIRDGDELLPANAVIRWNKRELKHWSSILGAPGADLGGLLLALAPLQREEIEGEKELLEERFEADFIVREGAPAEKLVPALEKILRADFALPVKMTFREVERKVYVASGKYRLVPVKGRPENRIELYGKDLTDPKLGNHFSGYFADFLRGAGTFMGKRIVAGKIEDVPQGRLQWHENILAAFTDAELQQARDPESVLKKLTEQTGLTFKEETRAVRVLFVERKD